MSEIRSETCELSEEDIKLHEASQPWKPSLKIENSSIEATSMLNVEEKIKRSILEKLNKLTPQKFNILLEKLKSLEFDSYTKLEILVNLIHQKAVNEPLYCATYAEMCKHLSVVRVPKENQSVSFRQLLLKKCQAVFEVDKLRILNDESNTDLEQTSKTQEELNYEEEKKIKDKMLGNIRLVGELFKLGILIEPIVQEILRNLISQNSEESLEVACLLLRITGKELDKKESSRNQIDSHIKNMQEVIERKCTSARIRFMLQDVIDLRKNDWVPRRVELTPKTIDEIHREVEQELLILDLC